MKRGFIYFLALLLTSCTMSKRLHNTGYHVEWSSKRNLPQKRTADILNTTDHQEQKKRQNEETITAQVTEEPVFTSSTGDRTENLHPKGIWNRLEAASSVIAGYSAADSCDNIILTNGTQIKGKVLEIEEDRIRYKRCDNSQGPLISLATSQIFMIQYANGTSESFSNSDTNSEKPKKKKLDIMGLLGFILSTSSIPIWWLLTAYAGLIGGVIGIAFGITSIVRIVKRRGERKGTLSFLDPEKR